MKYLTVVLLCVLLITDVSAKGRTKPKVPIRKLSETDTTSWILNTESNQYLDSNYLNTTLTLSSNGWDISVSNQNIPLYSGSQNTQNNTYLSVLKTVKLDNSTEITAGSQNGYQLFDQNIGKMHQFYFIDTLYKINDWTKIHGGGYYVNSVLSTKTNYFGGLSGIIIGYDKWKITADYFGGHTNVSGAVINTGYFITPWFNPYIGVGVPEIHSGNEFYGVIGVNIGTGAIK